MSATLAHKIVVRIPFPNEKLANYAKQIIDPDKELRPTIANRSLKVHEDILECEYNCESIKLCRLLVGTYLDNLQVVIRTMAEFANTIV